LRTETYIRQYISPEFYPYIQTPSFPEYPSGHSTISGAISQVLTNMIGDNISFTDHTHVPINLHARTFSTFFSAASEAGLSRMYGGIHFRAANINGMQMGRNIGSFVTTKIKFYYTN
jgi:membrane-associated phospholipid phosphatase